MIVPSPRIHTYATPTHNVTWQKREIRESLSISTDQPHLKIPQIYSCSFKNCLQTLKHTHTHTHERKRKSSCQFNLSTVLVVLHFFQMLLLIFVSHFFRWVGLLWKIKLLTSQKLASCLLGEKEAVLLL